MDDKERQGESMLTKEDLQRMQEADPTSCDIDDLVDLRDVTIDRSLPLRERFLDYVAQVKNPYLYKVGPIIVKLDKGGNIRFSDALTKGLLNS